MLQQRSLVEKQLHSVNAQQNLQRPRKDFCRYQHTCAEGVGRFGGVDGGIISFAFLVNIKDLIANLNSKVSGSMALPLEDCLQGVPTFTYFPPEYRGKLASYDERLTNRGSFNWIVIGRFCGQG
jgi:hypothetical protein